MREITIKIPVEIKSWFEFVGSQPTDSFVAGALYAGVRYRDFHYIAPNTITEHGKHVLQHLGLSAVSDCFWVGRGNNPSTWLEDPIYGFEIANDIYRFGGYTRGIPSANNLSILNVAKAQLLLHPTWFRIDVRNRPSASTVGYASRQTAILDLTPRTNASALDEGAPKLVIHIPDGTPTVSVGEIATFYVPGMATAVAGLKDALGNPMYVPLQPVNARAFDVYNTDFRAYHVIDVRTKGVSQNGITVNAYLGHYIFTPKETQEARELARQKGVQVRVESNPYPGNAVVSLGYPSNPNEDLNRFFIIYPPNIQPNPVPIEQYGTRYTVHAVAGDFHLYWEGQVETYLQPPPTGIINKPIASVLFSAPPSQLMTVNLDFIPQFFSDDEFIA